MMGITLGDRLTCPGDCDVVWSYDGEAEDCWICGRRGVFYYVEKPVTDLAVWHPNALDPPGPQTSKGVEHILRVATPQIVVSLMLALAVSLTGQRARRSASDPPRPHSCSTRRAG